MGQAGWSRVKVDQLYGITTVDLNNLGYRDEPFILANDAPNRKKKT
jgi:hypothetical protein